MESQSLTFRRHNGDWFNLESNDLICAKTVNSTGANRVNGDKNLSVSSVTSCSSIPEGRRHSKTGNAATKYSPAILLPVSHYLRDLCGLLFKSASDIIVSKTASL